MNITDDEEREKMFEKAERRCIPNDHIQMINAPYFIFCKGYLHFMELQINLNNRKVGVNKTMLT
jgi:hypothetical protein